MSGRLLTSGSFEVMLVDQETNVAICMMSKVRLPEDIFSWKDFNWNLVWDSYHVLYHWLLHRQLEICEDMEESIPLLQTLRSFVRSFGQEVQKIWPFWEGSEVFDWGTKDSFFGRPACVVPKGPEFPHTQECKHCSILVMNAVSLKKNDTCMLNTTFQYV